MDENLMLHWVEKVWKSSVAHFPCSYLLLDACTSHLTTALKEAFDGCNTEVDIIPKGYTFNIQPMEVGINKPVKNYINHQCDEMLVASIGELTKRQDVSWWIWNGWSQLHSTIVQNAWRGCGIDIDEVQGVVQGVVQEVDYNEAAVSDELDGDELLSDQGTLGLS
jgi:DDE superfamily endonuclease